MAKYTVELEARIIKDGAERPMSTTVQTYVNLDYADVVAMEEAILTALLAMGKAKLADKLKPHLQIVADSGMADTTAKR